MNTIRTTIRLSEELYQKVKSYLDKEGLITFNRFNSKALEYYLQSLQEEKPIIYSETSLEQQEQLKHYQTELDQKEEQIKIKDEQIRLKDQQILGLLALQKELTDKIDPQMKLLSQKIEQQGTYHELVHFKELVDQKELENGILRRALEREKNRHEKKKWFFWRKS